MKSKCFRLMTIFLSAVMMLAMSLNVMAAKSNTVTKDGLTVQLYTDKDSYKSGESVKASVQVENHSGKRIYAIAQINAPDGVILEHENVAFDTFLEHGESWEAIGGVVISTSNAAGATTTAGSSTATGDNMQVAFWVILTTLAVCGMITLFVYGKNRTTWLSIMLCIVMVGGMVVVAVPAQAASVEGSISLSSTIKVDDKDEVISATVSYMSYEEDVEASEEITEVTTPSQESSDSSEESSNSSSDTSEEPSEPSSDTSEEPSEPGSDTSEEPSEPSGPQELLANGGFEDLTAKGAPRGWAFSGGLLGDMFTIDKEEKSEGENALYCKSDNFETKAYGSYSFFGMVKGTEYVVTFRAKVNDAKKIAIKLEFSDTDEDGVITRLSGEEDIQYTYTEFATKDWTEYSFKFTAPGNIATLLARFYGGEVWFDDISIVGEKAVVEDTEEENDTAMNLKDPLPGAQNMVVNGSFEDLDATGIPSNWVHLNNLAVSSEPMGWFCSGEIWDGSGAVSLEEGEAYDGTHAVRIYSETTDNPYVGFYLRDIKPGAEYQIRARLNQINTASIGGMIKVEFFSDENKGKVEDPVTGQLVSSNLGVYTRENFAPAAPGWKQVVATFTVPENCKLAVVFLRVAGPGENMWDQIECYQTGEPEILLYETDNVFYYSDWTEGTATVSKNELLNTDLTGAKVSFALKDEAGTVLKEADDVSITNGEAKFTYALDLLTEKKTPYTVEYKCTDASGTVLDEGSQIIYKYDRPILINEDGVSLRPSLAADGTIKAGEEFLPVVGYHVRPQDYEYCKQAGINLIQLNMGQGASVESMTKTLDELAENNLYALVFLYFNMKPAGNEANQKSTARIVNAIKDHPAVYAWLCMDEPLLNGSTEEDLAASYKLIHDIDPVHPVYLVEAQSHAEYYDVVGKYCDVLAIDPYPNNVGATEKPMESNILKHTLLATEMSNYKKPIWVINQSMVKHTIADSFNPTSNDILHMHYQALMAGAKGLGYYDVRDLYGYVVKETEYEHMWERQHWDGIKYFKDYELDTAFRTFVTKEYTTIASNVEGNVWWRTYLKGEDMYAVMINTTAEEQTVDILLKNKDGSKVGEFKAVADKISNIGTINGEDTLEVTLSPAQCAIFWIGSPTATEPTPIPTTAPTATPTTAPTATPTTAPTATPTVAPTPTPIVANGSFEEITSGGSPKKWNLRTSATGDEISVTTNEAKEGSKALYCKFNSSDANGYAAQTITGLEEGTEYTVTFWAKQKNLKKFHVRVTSTNEQTNYGKLEKSDVESEEWIEYSFNFTAGADTAVLFARAWSGTLGAGESCEAWFDDISIEEAESSEESTPTPTPIPTATPTVAPTATPTVAPTATPTPIVANGDFENASGWKFPSSSSATIESGVGKDGGKALYCNPTGTGSEYAYQQITNLVVGQEYIVTFWAKQKNAKKFLIKLNNENLKMEKTCTSLEEDWTEYSFTFEATGTTDVLNAQAYANSNNNCEVWFDNISVVKAETVESTASNLVADGGFENDGVWTLKNNATMESGVGRNNSKALYCNPTGTGSEYAYQQITNLVVGQEYIVTFWAKQKNAKKFLIKLDGETLIMEKTCTSTEEDWAEYSFTFKATATTVTFNAQVYADSSKTNCEAWFDDISIVAN